MNPNVLRMEDVYKVGFGVGYTPQVFDLFKICINEELFNKLKEVGFEWRPNDFLSLPTFEEVFEWLRTKEITTTIKPFLPYHHDKYIFEIKINSLFIKSTIAWNCYYECRIQMLEEVIKQMKNL